MSCATLHGFNRDGIIYSINDYRNAWHGAMLVWMEMAKKYGIPNGERITYDEKVANQVWSLPKNKDMTEADRITLMTTFDHFIVYKQDFPALIAAMKESATWLPENCHIIKQAEDVEKAINDEDLIAVAWTQTSVADCWGSGQYDEHGESVPYNLNKHTQHKNLFEILKEYCHG
jgi:hypothetical protein